MRWSKLKAEIESRFCDSMKNRLSINSTAYGACTCGHAWISLDKEVIANFCTMAFWKTEPHFDPEKGRFLHGERINENNKKYEKFENAYGELSRQDVYGACWEYVHDLSIDQAISSKDPLIQSLAMVDRRLGKRRLREIDDSSLHPLAKRLLHERMLAEKMEIT